MRKLNKFKTILTSIVICFVFVISSYANTKTEVDCSEPITEIVHYEPSCVVIIHEDLNYNDILIKDGKFWKALLELWDGFKISLEGGPMPISGGGSSGENNEELNQHIEKFAKNHVRNRDNAYRIFYKMQKLIESDKETVSKNEILNIINPKSSGRPHPRWLRELLDDIFKTGGTNPRPTVKPNSNVHLKPIKLTKRDLKIKKISGRDKPNNNDEVFPKRKINWKRVGWIIGEIIKRI